MTDLQEIRGKIDTIDRQIVELFEKRMEICQEVAADKIKTGKPVFDPAREAQKIEAVSQMTHNELNAIGIGELFKQIMSISRKMQYQLMVEAGKSEENPWDTVEHLPVHNARVVFQGVEGAYSYAAMKAYFPEGVESFHVNTFRDAMSAINEEQADYGVLPIENSTAGIVTDIYDLLAEFNLYIVGEQIVPCQHMLLGLPDAYLEDIHTVFSHPQALSQCKEYLDEHPAWRRKEWLNTAGSAKKIAEDKDRHQAAIASRSAAEFYGLKILKENIFSNAHNSTRFIIVSKKPVFEKKAKKISVCFEVPHESGSLYHTLSHFIYNGLNMTKIESRPILEKNWEYRFFVDFEGNLEDVSVKNALLGIQKEAKNLRVFGNY